jgi:hypothetical protein
MDPKSKEDRIAMRMAVKCPGKTHALIKSKTLRAEFAKELNDWRNQRNQVKKEHGGWRADEFWAGMRWGLESGFWAMEKTEGRAFIYDQQDVSWQLVPKQDTRTPEYKEYEAKVIAAHSKKIELIKKIEADFEAGEIDMLTMARRRRHVMDREEEKIKELQKQYGI